MLESSQYKTRQSEELLAYLRTTKGSHVTAKEIARYFASCGNPIGVATIYRQMERLVDAGLVNKYYLAQGGGAHFEFVNREEDCSPLCFHCKCEQCGALIHLQCSSLEQIKAHLLSDHGFSLDPIRTVFYGTCRDCSTTTP